MGKIGREILTGKTSCKENTDNKNNLIIWAEKWEDSMSVKAEPLYLWDVQDIFMMLAPLLSTDLWYAFVKAYDTEILRKFCCDQCNRIGGPPGDWKVGVIFLCHTDQENVICVSVYSYHKLKILKRYCFKFLFGRNLFTYLFYLNFPRSSSLSKVIWYQENVICVSA